MKTKKQLRAEAVEYYKSRLDDDLMAKGYRAKAEVPLDELIDLLIDDEPQTNLEWLYENDRDALVDFMECDDCEVCRALDYCHNENHSREWLMAEHDCGQIADMSQKSADCVRSEPEMSENLGSDLRTSEDFEVKGSEVDSREKLEADIEKRAVHAETIFGPLRIGTVKVGTNVIHRWLDRQTAITERETVDMCKGAAENLDRVNDELRAKLDDMERQRDYWKQQVQLCMDSAYPPGHSPDRAYAPEVMAYLEMEGYTTPSTMVSAVIDGLRDEMSELAGALERVGAERDELQGKVDKLERENARLSSDELQVRSDYERVVEQNAGLQARLRKVREAAFS